MLVLPFLLLCPHLFSSTCLANVFDARVITEVRHGIEKGLHYIDENHHRVNVDCLFGVVLTAVERKPYYQSCELKICNSDCRYTKNKELNGITMADCLLARSDAMIEPIPPDTIRVTRPRNGPIRPPILKLQAMIKDVHMNGTHIMDASSQNIIEKSMEILRKTMPLVPGDKLWIAKFILMPELWQKEILFKKSASIKSARPNHRILEKIYVSEKTESPLPNSDFCLHDISVWTSNLEPKTCRINIDCWAGYYGYSNISSGYTLTHKLLLLQLARARKCLIEEKVYERETKKLCSSIFAEVFNGDYFHALDDMFDLFLEQVVLCGYEGYPEFFENRWLHYILKSQKSTGCFTAKLTDDLKSRIKKRNMNIFEDGCVDHTTGLGTAALAIYYNFIIKESISVFSVVYP